MRDESAFAELVRRHGPVVWGVCRRRLANQHDAEDAFQATFLVLVHRAAGITADVPLGPWLHRVAAMTARNVIRGNRRREPVSRPMEHDVPAHEIDPGERLDLDAALLALPESYRLPVVLCHLQGLSQREAAERLGCPEGTLSARLHRALMRLRAGLGVRGAAALAVAGATVAPAALSAATVRSAVIYTTSTLTATGVSPTVAGLTDGVLRMFWMKKMAAGLVLAVLVTGGLVAGFTIRPGNAAQATVPMAAEPEAPLDDPDAVAKQLDRRLADLMKQKELLDATLVDLQAEKAKLNEAAKAKVRAAEAAELGKDIAVEVGSGDSAYAIREVVNGKVAVATCSNLDLLRTYLTRAFNDPKGPKQLRVSAAKDHSYDDLKGVLAACAEAGYTKASFSHSDRRYSVRLVAYSVAYKTYMKALRPHPPQSGRDRPEEVRSEEVIAAVTDTRYTARRPRRAAPPGRCPRWPAVAFVHEPKGCRKLEIGSFPGPHSFAPMQ